MIDCARDESRHDRMLDLTGGDAAALAEVRTTLDHIVAQEEPDLASALALACHRDRLIARNDYITDSLPPVWAALGRLARSHTLAASISNLYRRARALAQIAGALAQDGQHQQAAALATGSRDLRLLILLPLPASRRPRSDRGALAQAGQHQQAEDLLSRCWRLPARLSGPACWWRWLAISHQPSGHLSR